MTRPSYSKVFILSSMLTMVLVSAVNFLVDPFTYYHPPWISINFSKIHRFSNPGLARQFEYRSVLIGTSHVMELESSRFSEIIRKPGLNLATNGGLIREQAELVELVLKEGKADSIYWEMNFPSFSVGDIVGMLGQQYPDYFYSPSIETPFRYLVSFDSLLQSWEAISNPGQVTIDNRNELVIREFSRKRVLAAWNYEIATWTDDFIRYWADIQRTVEAPEVILKRRLEPMFRDNPGVTFKLILPPNSILLFLLFEAMGTDDLERWLEFRAALARLVKDYPNAQLHDFQADWSTIENLDLYRDLEHYNREVLEDIFVQVEQQSRQVNQPALLDNNKELRKRVFSTGMQLCAMEGQRCSDHLKRQLEQFKIDQP